MAQPEVSSGFRELKNCCRRRCIHGKTHIRIRTFNTHAQVPGELWGGRLALALLAARAAGGDSAFAAYVSHLPRGFPGVPVFYSREAIDALDYPPVVEQVGICMES